MELPVYIRLGIAPTLAAFALAACSAAESNAGPTLASYASGSSSDATKNGNVAAETAPVSRGISVYAESWMSVAAKGGQALMYVSNVGNGTVTVYDYSGGKTPSEVGELTGFEEPTPGCTDRKGHVFIPDANLETISEYAYGSSTPSQVLKDTGYGPFGCSVDPKTGNLAVANFDSASVSIYAGAAGSPTVYSVGIPVDQFVAYNARGDLFVAGRTSNVGSYLLSEAPSGSTKFKALTIKGGSVAFPGQLQWGGTYLLVGDQGTYEKTPSYVDQVSVDGTTATIVKQIALTGTVDVVAGYKRGSGKSASYAAPDISGNSGSGAGFIFSFPGATTISTFSHVDQPIGAVVVQKSS